jgi:hypothetical protein
MVIRRRDKSGMPSRHVTVDQAERRITISYLGLRLRVASLGLLWGVCR